MMLPLKPAPPPFVRGERAVSNIVKRLRGLAKAEMFLGAYTEAKSITDAADEIERLRAELAEATKDRNVFFADLVDTKSRLAEAERLLRKAAKARYPSVVSDLIGNYFAKGGKP